ncbi:MAG: hypothetical protein OEZ33_08355 [Gammaproteobacteria bacterium]|nr:hypothetical protein [Gammaproteobacteria bacterium]MDH5778209.1 hypothetical protein [Gammaproteobacteria bacterium]
MSNDNNKPDTDIDPAQLELAQQAASGDKLAREKVNQLIHPVINFQTGRFCKRFCKENRYKYVCTLSDSWSSPTKDAVFCEWGNASYAWMLDDLSNSKRLLQYSGKNGARLYDYIYYIANSLPFYERWKDWRFGRKVHVPTYIQELSPAAGKVFYAMRSGDQIPLIAQKIMQSIEFTEALCRQIIILLTQKKRLHLLDPPATVSLTQLDPDQDTHPSSGGQQTDVPVFDETPEFGEDKQQLATAWQTLSPAEQYVIEAMVMEEQDANDVLLALKKLNISIKDGVPASETNRQQLYYFRRKTLNKLADLMR